MRFGWEETRGRLDAAPYGTEIPLGEPALATMALSMMGLCGGDATPTCRTTANNLYAVVAGSGCTDVNGERFNWQRGDVIAAPAWQPHPCGLRGCRIVSRQRRAANVAARVPVLRAERQDTVGPISVIAAPRRRASLDVSS